MAGTRGAVENALENPLILQLIFKNLSFSDLLDCRLVNRSHWFELATEAAFAKSKSKIDFNSSDALKKVTFSFELENYSPLETLWTLKSLVNCIRQSQCFPCSRFRFSQVYLDEDEDLLEFFSIHGESIVELEIDLIDRTRSSNVVGKFGELLRQQLPNLEKLTIWKVSLDWGSSVRLFTKRVRETTKLEKLKYLYIEKSLDSEKLKFIQDIQDAAPDLEQVEKIKFEPPKIQKDPELAHTFHEEGERKWSLSFSPKPSNIRYYERLVRIKPKFTSISINLYRVRNSPDVRVLSRAAFTLTQILKLSQPTLKNLDGVMEILCWLEIPLDSLSFPLISKLSLSSFEIPAKIQSRSEESQDKEKNKRGESSSTLNLDLEPTCNISQTFPSLSEVIIYFSPELFQRCGVIVSWPTVKILKSHRISCPGDFQKLANMLPNVEDFDFELRGLKTFQECADSLWKNFGKVTTLGIRISEKVRNSDSYPEDVSMDNAFLGTGNNASILELQELKRLHVTFTPSPPKIISEAGPQSPSPSPSRRRSESRRQSRHRFESRRPPEKENGKWAHWNFLRKATLIHLRENLRQLESIVLVVDATDTDCKSEAEIYTQLEELRPFANVKVYLNPIQRKR